MRCNKHENQPEDYIRAKNLRNNPTPWERQLWNSLRHEAERHKFKFRRQQAIHPYIVDFACLDIRLIVEIDGYSHDIRADYDRQRDAKLDRMGFKTLRFSNDEVKTNLEGVVQTIIKEAEILRSNNYKKYPPPLTPPREGAGDANADLGS